MTDAPDVCGCPPTMRTDGAVHHVIINVTDLERSRAFYDWLMPRLGYAKQMNFPGMTGYYNAAGSFWIQQSHDEFRADRFHKNRVGLCELAFRADDRAQIDQLGRDLTATGATILDPPQEYAYMPGYYAIFFTDPDGMKLELVHIPAPK
jgi:catechol 2,3-dioxygenase-like lactoylglutathione lyase family enzyme